MDTINMNNLIKIVKEYFPEKYEEELLVHPENNEKIFELKEHNKHKIQYFLNIFNDNFMNHAVFNDSDLDEFNSLEYSILLHKNQPILDNDIKLIESLNYTKYELCISISIFEDVYYSYINKIMYDPVTCMWNIYNDINSDNDDHKETSNKLDSLMAYQKYTKLNRSEISTPVKNISTALVSKGNVKLFHALFNDIKTPFQDEFCL